MLYNQHVMKMMERQQRKKTRQFYHALAELNLSLNQIHKSIGFYIDKEKYQYATEYVDQFISYTTVWNLKFVYNLESPEVALLQIFHLSYIFDHEDASSFLNERHEFEKLKQDFKALNPYSEERIQNRYEKMLQFINQHSKVIKTER